MTWNPTLYLSFGAQRTRPAADLLARVPLQEAARVVDLGCGPGNSTALLQHRFPRAALVGLDSSSAMIDAAKRSDVNASFVVADFETYSPAPDTQLIFANAAFQWSSDPIGLAGRLLKALQPGGVLALQTPQNYDQPSHTAIEAVARHGPWAEKLAALATYDPGGFERAESYARALSPYCAALDVWTTTYLHTLQGEDPVFAWMSATGLRPFLSALEGGEDEAFADAMRAAYRVAYPPEPDGSTLFPFRRMFVVAVRGE